MYVCESSEIHQKCSLNSVYYTIIIYTLFDDMTKSKIKWYKTVKQKGMKEVLLSATKQWKKWIERVREKKNIC